MSRSYVVSDFGDSYRIYRACEIVIIFLNFQVLQLKLVVSCAQPEIFFRKDSGQSGWWQLSKCPLFHDSTLKYLDFESNLLLAKQSDLPFVIKKCAVIFLLKLPAMKTWISLTGVCFQMVQLQWSTPTRMQEQPPTSLSSDRNCSMLNQYLLSSEERLMLFLNGIK